jgi:DNA-binding NarL/FixJ family response regulator
MAVPEETERSRIVIADDHPLYRDALKRMVSEASDFSVVGEAADGREALELCRRLHPTLVVMDVRMPLMDGLAATRAIKAEFPLTIVLILTCFEDSHYLEEAINAGAGGYILKDYTQEQIINSIVGVLHEEPQLNEALAMQLLKTLLANQQEYLSQRRADLDLSERPIEDIEEPVEQHLPKKLTPRELEILLLLSAGKTNRQIMQELSISLSTVKTHLEHVMSKLEVSDRMQAALLALKLGLFKEDKKAD